MTNENYYSENDKESTTFRDLLDKYLEYWKWFVIAALISLAIGSLYLYLTTPMYLSVASIIVKDEKSNGSSKEDNTSFIDLGQFGGIGTNSIENELGLLRSKRLMTNSVKALGLNVQYFEKRRFQMREIYSQSPYKIEVLRLDDKKLMLAKAEERTTFEIIQLTTKKIQLRNISTDETHDTPVGGIVELDFADFSIQANPMFEQKKDSDDFKKITISFETTDRMATYYQSTFEANLIEEEATLIMLSLVDPLKEKAQDILNQLVLEYNREAIDDKKLIAENTSYFIDERLKIINDELDSVETGKEEFKESNMLTNLDRESSLIMENASEYNIKQEQVETQLELVQAIKQYLQSDNTELLPSNIGIDETGIAQLITEYNQLIIERNKLLIGSTLKNPLVVNLDNQIAQLKSNLRVSLERVQSSLRITRNNLQRQAGIIGSQISDVPAQERQFRGIERQQNIKEALYLFLLQKREENSLALAATAPKAKIVDQAYSYGAPIAPNSMIVLLVSLLFGLAIPFSYINIIALLNNKVRDRDDLKKIKNLVPLLGEIPHLQSEESTIIKKNKRSITSEAFRILATNLYRSSANNKLSNKGTCVFVTSTIKGEGKTFTSVNLALTLAFDGKKVLLVGADFRNPQLHHLSSGKKADMESYNSDINQYQQLNYHFSDSKLDDNLKLLLSVKNPPRPAELLQHDKVSEMLTKLREYFDFIVVDTAPAMLIADTFLMAQNADLSLYVIRAGHTKKKLLDFIDDSVREEKLINPTLLLNDVMLKDTAYGNGYYYGDHDDEASDVLQRIKSFFTKIVTSESSGINSLVKRMKNRKKD